MDWFLFDRALRHERANLMVLKFKHVFAIELKGKLHSKYFGFKYFLEYIILFRNFVVSFAPLMLKCQKASQSFQPLWNTF